MKPEEEQAIEAALREKEPTTQEGWLKWEQKLGQVILRSDVWPPTPQSHGHWSWEIRHPASGRKTQGVEHHITECYAAMDRVLRSWFPDVEGMTIARLQP